MRITIYNTEMDEDKKPFLIKEKAVNYSTTDKLNSPDKIVKMFNEIFRAMWKTEEHTWIIAFNSQFHPVGVFEISHGTVNASLLSPREIFIRLLLCGATRFVTVHNHPSGNSNPSTEDKKITEALTQMGKLMDILLLDHIIIGENEFFSFAQNGYIEGVNAK